MKRKLRFLSLMAAAMAFNLAWAIPANRPTQDKATYDAESNRVIITAVAPTETEYDWDTYQNEILDHITKVTIERHAPSTAWPEQPIGVLTDIVPGGEIRYVDSTVNPDEVYEYRITCWVDNEKGSPTWVSCYTGIRPGRLQDFTVTTPDHKTAQFDVTFTAPTVDENGNPLASIGTVEIEMMILYTWYTVASVTDIAPGETFSFPVTDGVEIGANYSLRAYARIGEKGNGEATEAGIYIGEDIPATPVGMVWEETPDKLILTWELPEKGGRGGSIDPDNVTYNVYVRYSGDKEFTQLAKNHPGERYEMPIDLTEEEVMQFGISAINPTGESYHMAETPMFTAGPYASFPFTESFTGAQWQHRGWIATGYESEYYSREVFDVHDYQTEYYPKEDIDIMVNPQDEDGGLLAASFYGYMETGSEFTVTTPRISFENANNPILSMWYYYIPVTIEGTDHEIRVCASAEGGEFEEVFHTSSLDKPEDHSWRQIVVELPALAGKKYGQVRIGVIRGSWTQDVSIDNIRIYEDEGAGTGSVAASDEDLPAEFYNLQGIRVDNPGKGVYIRRQGNSSTKVLINE